MKITETKPYALYTWKTNDAGKTKKISCVLSIVFFISLLLLLSNSQLRAVVTMAFISGFFLLYSLLIIVKRGFFEIVPISTVSFGPKWITFSAFGGISAERLSSFRRVMIGDWNWKEYSGYELKLERINGRTSCHGASIEEDMGKLILYFKEIGLEPVVSSNSLQSLRDFHSC